MAILGRAAVELSRGQLAAADASAQQALGVLRAIGDATWTSAALAVGAEIERARGRLEEAGRQAAEAIEVARRANSAINVMIATGQLGRILLAGGKPGAGDCLDQAVQLARAFAVRPLLAWWLDSLGELAELEGRYDDARSWYEQAAGHAAECGLPVDAARARHHRARLAWLEGEYLGLGPCDVIGYSLGGYIAQQLAVTCPALVRRLDPIPSSFDVADLLLSLHSMAQLQNDDNTVKVTISLIEAGGPWTNPGRLGQYQADLAWLQDTSHLDRLRHITSPCLAMAFEHDCWFPPRVVREAAQRMGDCQYVELSGLGHGAPLLAPSEVNPVLTKFLD